MTVEPFRVEPTGLEELDRGDGPGGGTPLAGSLLQSGFWARHKARFGWRAHPFRCAWRGEEFPLLVLSRPLAPGLALAYVPHGPLLEPPAAEREAFLAGLGRALRPRLPAGTLFLRFDPPWSVGEAPPAGGAAALHPAASRRGRLRRAPMDIQPPATVVVDLRPPEETLLERMKPKTRYNIRLALRKGVEVAEGGREDLPAWYALYRETARRDRIALHGFGYYDALFAACEEAARAVPAGACGASGGVPSAELRETRSVSYPRIRLFLARHEGDLLAGIVVAQKPQAAWYLYGASADRKRSLMPSYAAQWTAMRALRADGCPAYDLFGIPPREDPAHPMAGLYRFKTGFGGAILHRPGCWDLPCRPLAYRGYRLAEAGRRFWFGRVRKLRVRRGGTAGAAPAGAAEAAG